MIAILSCVDDNCTCVQWRSDWLLVVCAVLVQSGAGGGGEADEEVEDIGEMFAAYGGKSGVAGGSLKTSNRSNLSRLSPFSVCYFTASVDQYKPYTGRYFFNFWFYAYIWFYMAVIVWFRPSCISCIFVLFIFVLFVSLVLTVFFLLFCCFAVLW